MCFHAFAEIFNFITRVIDLNDIQLVKTHKDHSLSFKTSATDAKYVKNIKKCKITFNRVRLRAATFNSIVQLKKSNDSQLIGTMYCKSVRVDGGSVGANGGRFGVDGKKVAVCKN